MNINLTVIAEYAWIIAAVIALIVLLIKNLAHRQQIAHLKKRLQERGSYEQYVTYLQNQLQGKDKVAAIKALRQQFPELSLIEATQLWQQVYAEQQLNKD